MAYDFGGFKQKIEEIEKWLASEFSSIRTGRATPLILDRVMVDSYGTKTPIKHLATISIDDPRTLRVSPWDQGQLKAIESAISASNLGVSTSPDSTSIRVIFPELSTERRTALMKLAGDKLEEAKISIRREREKIWDDIQMREKSGQISEDEKFRLKNELQKIVDEANLALDKKTTHKEDEIKN